MRGISSRGWYSNPADFDAVTTDFYPTLTTLLAHSTELIFRRQSGELFWGRMSGRGFDGVHPMEGDSAWVIENT